MPKLKKAHKHPLVLEEFTPCLFTHKFKANLAVNDQVEFELGLCIVELDLIQLIMSRIYFQKIMSRINQLVDGMSCQHKLRAKKIIYFFTQDLSFHDGQRKSKSVELSQA